MILEAINGVVERYSNATCLENLHNRLIQLVVGKKAVIMNLDISFTDRPHALHISNKITHGLYLDKVAISNPAPVCLTLSSFKGTNA